MYYDVRSELGHGFLEQVCHRAMVVALADEGLRIREEVPLTVWFRGRQIARFSVDLVVEDVVLVEVKAFNQLEPRHKAQMLNYLRASDLEVGLLLNFGPRSEFERFVYSNSRKNRPKCLAAGRAAALTCPRASVSSAARVGCVSACVRVVRGLGCLRVRPCHPRPVGCLRVRPCRPRLGWVSPRASASSAA